MADLTKFVTLMPSTPVGRYAWALPPILIALLLTIAIEPLLGGTVLPPSFAALLFTAIFAGAGPAFIALVVGAVGIKLFFLPPLHTLLDFTQSSAVRLGLFVVLGSGLIWLGDALRDTYRRLLKAVLTREHVLAIVSHDLRNLLTLMVLQTRSLKRKGKVPAEVDRIDRAADQMTGLVSDLLDYSAIESGQLAIRPQRVELRQLVIEAASSFSTAASERGLQLRTDTPSEPVPGVCDPQRISQVLSNLLGNALKFTPSSGTITVELRAEDRQAMLTVRNTGSTIAPENLSRVFERYWKADESDRRGAGLGLAISKAIVLGHHGKIWAESEASTGTAFCFTLPREARLAQSPLPTGDGAGLPAQS